MCATHRHANWASPSSSDESLSRSVVVAVVNKPPPPPSSRMLSSNLSLKPVLRQVLPGSKRDKGLETPTVTSIYFHGETTTSNKMLDVLKIGGVPG